jgi:aminoglycoside/choline kinase family phosphotransferase
MSLHKGTIAFIETACKDQIKEVQAISGSGSPRLYHRIILNGNKTVILTQNPFIAENETFFYIQNLWSQNGINVPSLLAIDPTRKMYLQEDIGNLSLLQLLNQKGLTEEVQQYYIQSLQQLSALQLNLSQKTDFTNCYDFQKFDFTVVQNDLFYAKNYFWDYLNLPYQKGKFIEAINSLSMAITDLPSHFFLYRDFQARNLMIHNEKVYFIDFQGGMRGFIGYDVVSLLHQAKANLSVEVKQKLKEIYFERFLEKGILDRSQLEKGYYLALILRTFQLLGAYGLRGLVEKKQHFIESIFIHLENLKLLLNQGVFSDFPYLEQVCHQLFLEDLSSIINEKIKS